jgi:uncharacterized integral membrane protein
MQVGLAVDELAKSVGFRRISFAFAVFSMFAVMLVVLAVVLGWVILLSSHFLRVRTLRKTLRSKDENT